MGDKSYKFFSVLNLVFLGIVMLVSGLVYLLYVTPQGLANMFTLLGFPVPIYLAWIVIIVEILLGLAILGQWKLRISSTISAVILVVMAVTFYFYGPGKYQGAPNWEAILVYLALATNYLFAGWTSR